jgi:outer membrane protein assembly factor BamB
MLRAALVMMLCLASGVAAATEDWPRWLGPRGDGISHETTLIQPWPKGLRKVWSAPVGRGFASPIAVDGRVYVFHAVGNVETITSYQADTGKVVWREGDDGTWTGDLPGTRATPWIEGRHIFSYGGVGDLSARYAANGLALWRLNVLHEVGGQPDTWGVASSPLVVGDLIYVQVGVGGPVAVAVDRKTGRIVWRSEPRGTSGYAAPILVDVAGTKQLIIFGGDNIYGLQPDTGRQIWSYSWPTSMAINAATPFYRDGLLFVSAAYGHGGLQLRLTPTSAEKVWETKQVLARFNPPIYDDGYLYVNSEGVLKCVSWKDGKVVWAAEDQDLRLGIGGSLVRVGDKLLAMSERGLLTLFKATPAGFSKLGAFQIQTGNNAWATPLLYRNRLYVRGETELTCWELP